MSRLHSRRTARWYWPLAAVLAVQAALSLPLVWANTAFTDEALYLSAGRLEIAHLLRGAPVPPFATYFSGSPALYPPLGALADSVAGLAGARVLSLLFMLGATALLWAVTSRWWGRQAGFFAAALWAVAGPTLHLGSFATYDAMSLFLLALATWLAMRAGQHFDAAGWMALSGTALVLANATKYATVLFDPVVISLAVLSGFPRPGGIRAFARGLMLATHSAILAGALLLLAGHTYLTGLKVTTFSRAIGVNTVASVAASAWGLSGVVVCAAGAGVLLSFGDRLRWHARLMTAALAASALLVPLAQARLHTLVSLNKHVDFGMWFAAIAAGYGTARLVTLFRSLAVRRTAAAVLACAVAPAAVLGQGQARQMTEWPAAATLVAFLGPRLASGDQILAEASPVPAYYLRKVPWDNWSNTFNIVLPSGQMISAHNSAAPYIDGLRANYFSFVILSFTETPAIDRAIADYLGGAKNYSLIGKVPFGGSRRGFYLIWQRAPLR